VIVLRNMQKGVLLRWPSSSKDKFVRWEDIRSLSHFVFLPVRGILELPLARLPVSRPTLAATAAVTTLPSLAMAVEVTLCRETIQTIPCMR
jgi:hypothetical protein